MNKTVLRVEGLRKQFGGTRALDDVSIELREREVLGVVGANGAGKSTLLKVLAGQCRADGGRIVLRGRPISPRSGADANDAGIGMVFQEQSLLPNVSVAENILLGHEDAALHAGFYHWRTLNALAARQLAKLGCSIAPAARTDSLSFAERQMVELAKVLAIEERTQHEPVILLDEPTSMLDAGQIETVLTQIERLRGRASVVFVSHRLDEVMRVCDRLYVMSDGCCVAQRERGSYQVADLQQLMLGRAVNAEDGPRAAPLPTSRSAVMLSVRALSRARNYHAVSFDLHAGEVLGLAGGAGSGCESLCRSLFGAEAPDSGEIVLDGKPVRLNEPADAVRLGIGYVPAERRLEGIVAGLSVRENLTLAHLEGLRRGPFIDLARERELVSGWIDRLRIKPTTPEMPETPAHHLSGGNQQKLVLAKWLITGQPKLLILDHPLRGLDVGAKTEIMRLIRELAGSGIGILLIADTLDELVALSDAVLVMKDGGVSGRFPATGTPVSELQILERMV
ncbi:sugar ABC transporter ATP-binding protein [Aquabacterium sp.]|uniref:sugar ABC transporter ATP-binding protein n=1 Tax=Aquabacterium sp. TaxID=1872578 RepID=UPI002C9C9728|nr:sugar ABC transporter ATP-binding protein [Aquabacterium sp.]HSW07196.1 sugar ABC transporter ATP-binding protein [Aquabacterium sp.]